MSTETQRAEFEKWADAFKSNRFRSSVTGTYDYPLGNYLWAAWQAAQSSQAAEIEALRKDAELWQYWKPWLERRLGDLSKYDAAMQTKETS